MSWVVVAVGVTTAAVSAGGTYMANKKQKEGTEAAMGNARAAFGSVPEAAEYQPVNFDREALANIIGNYTNLPASEMLAGRNNAFLDRDALARVQRIIPGYKSAMATYGAAGNDLLNGRLPWDDVMGIVSNRNEMTNALGIPGTGTNATLKDLGLSQLDAVKAGGGILKDMVGIAETINPVGRRMSPQSMMISPQDRINMTMQQNQLIQQSDQNKYNLAASGDPTAYAQLQLQLAQAGNDAAAIKGYANAANQAIGAIGGGVQSYMNPAPMEGWGGNMGVVPGASSSYYNSRPAYYNGSVVPRATAA